MAKMTNKQRELISKLRLATAQHSGWNNFDADQIADVLEENLSLWSFGYWNPEQSDDTILLIPRKGKEHQLALLGPRQMSADEYDMTATLAALAGVFGIWDWDNPFRASDLPKEAQEDLKLFRNVKSVLRLWWD